MPSARPHRRPSSALPSGVCRTCLGLALVCLLVSWAAPATGQVPSPESQFGFRLGAEGRLADADAIERYFDRVAATSDRVRLVDMGRSTEGHRMPAAIVSSPANLRNLDAIHDANRRLADPRTLAAGDVEGLTRSHKAVIAIGASIHAEEIGGTQAVTELLYRLSSADDPDTRRVLDDLIVILIPMLNPDGHRLVTDWYAKQKGTPFEGSAMPWLDHPYAGHDVNRDAFMMNLAENQNLSRFFYREWHPQVFLTLHQMDSFGARIFVPPNTDPIEPNYDPVLWRTAGLLGSAMAFELQRTGHRGVLSNGLYDYYWPGYEDSAPLGHNTVCLLVETASARVASSVRIAPEDLRGGQRGLPEYTPRINFPDPWPGGTWTLADIVDYDLTAIQGLLQEVARHRGPIVQNFYAMGRRAVDAGARGGPFAFLVPPSQRDGHAAVRLRELLLDSQVEIHRAQEAFRAGGETYPAGTDIVFMAQPFRAYVKTLLERQRYPERVTIDGRREPPYDVTGWTLPLQLGVDVRTIQQPFEPPLVARLTTAAAEPAPVWGVRRPGHYVIDGRGTTGIVVVSRLMAAGLAPAWITTGIEVNGYRFEPGAIVVRASRQAEQAVTAIARELGVRVDGVRGNVPAGSQPIGRARVGLYRSWTANVDEGWTRWVFERYGLPVTSLRDADVRGGNLRARVDAIVIPSIGDNELVSGHVAGYPSEYLGGIGQDGIEALRAFVAAGGSVICLDEATAFALRAFEVPMRDVTAPAGETLVAPGSLVALDVDTSLPWAFGLDPNPAALFSTSSAFTPDPRERVDTAAMGPVTVTTIARYAARDLLLSGYLEGEQILAGQAAAVDVQVGRGHVVLIGFPAQHRGQSLATFRLLFNAVLTAPASDQTPARRRRR